MYQLRDRRREEGAPTFDEHGLAIPGRGLRRLVAGQLGDNLDAWLRSGEQDARLIREMFERHRGPLSEIGAILDFGSGCGRVARWWANLDGPELFGCDYDGRLTAWCRSNLPFLSVKTNSSRPPLPFRGETFDLIYAISLFTHLTEVAQDGWMQDLRRLLKPGALVLFTVHGERFVGHLTAEEREAFTAGRHVVRLPERSGREACAAFHPPSYVRDRLVPSAGLELLEAVDEGGPEEPIGSPMVLQDSYLVRKPATA